MVISDVSAVALSAPWEAIFHGATKVPDYLWKPAAHFSDFPRRGQYGAFVRVQTTAGQEGFGEAWGLPLPSPVAVFINDYLGPALRGREFHTPEDIATWQSAAQQMADSLGYGRGLWREALSGIDLALWDALARENRSSVARFVSGREAEPVSVYASPVPFLPTPGDSAHHATALVQRGYKAIKIKAGRANRHDDIAHYQAVREAVGPHVALMADFNCHGNWDNIMALVQAAGQGDTNAGLCWIEEPFHPDDWEGMARLRREIGIPVAAGENAFTVAEFSHLIGSGAVDIVTPNITRCGGLTGLLQIAAVANAHNVRVSLHGVGGIGMLAASLQAVALLPNAEPMERNVLPNPLRDELALVPLSESEGKLTPLSGPGWGYVPDAGRLQKYAL